MADKKRIETDSVEVLEIPANVKVGLISLDKSQSVSNNLGLLT
jgi:hypothetical protein